MEQTVYADLLFLINFSMDFLCLFLTSKLLCRKLFLPRAIAASTLGGIYAVLELVFLPQTALGILPDIGFCILMCLVAFFSFREKFSNLLLLSATYILASALLGGVMTACFSLLNRYAPPVSEENADIPVWIFCLVTVTSALATFFGGRHLRKKASTAGAQVEIFFDGRRLTLQAMCDSGNLLRDPVSGRPVLLVENKLASALFPHTCPPTPETVSSLPASVCARIRLIPTSSVGGTRMIVALRPDRLLLRDAKGTHQADALVGFAELSECQALMPPELVL